ncbi:MAG: glycosyltransferase family 39 protein [Ignavibacteria bacterium]
MKYKQPVKIVLLISAIAVIIRVISVLIFAELNNPEMWEFGQIARSLLDGKGFVFMANTIPVPSAFMPPGLPYLYYFFFIIFGDNHVSYFLILLLNSILSGISVLLVYKLSKEFYSSQVGIYSALYISLSPVFIYSSLTYNSLIIYHVLLLLLFITVINSFRYFEIVTAQRTLRRYKDVLLLGIVLGVFLYFRSEMLGFSAIISILFFLKRQMIRGLLVLLIPVLLILPWTIRNYYTFGTIVPVSTSMGYNFYTGHGDDHSTVAYLKSVSQLKEDSTFEINKSKISFEHAFEYITHHPKDDAAESIKKVFSLWVLDLYRDTAKNPVYIAVWLPTLLFFLIGLYKSMKIQPVRENIKILILYLLFSTALVVLFFNIPRYQIQMSIVMVPTAMYGLQQLLLSAKNKTQS